MRYKQLSTVSFESKVHLQIPSFTIYTQKVIIKAVEQWIWDIFAEIYV